MNVVIPGTLYEHKKTGAKYRVTSFAEDKSKGRDGVYLVVYVRGVQTFAREIGEFMAKFSEYDKETSEQRVAQ